MMIQVNTPPIPKTNEEFVACHTSKFNLISASQYKNSGSSLSTPYMIHVAVFSVYTDCKQTYTYLVYSMMMYSWIKMTIHNMLCTQNHALSDGVVANKNVL